MLCAMSGASANDYDFEVDGIYYKKDWHDELYVVKKDDGFKYSGDVVIPAQVKYGNKTYRVTDIGSYTFWDCDELTGITIPNTISRISDDMFTLCKKLKKVIFEDGETVLKLGKYQKSDDIFKYCPIETLYLGRNLSYENIANPFKGKDKLKEVTIGKFVTEIQYRAFGWCTSLTSVTIPNSVTSIDSEAFTNCSSLKTVTIPNSVTSIGHHAFSWCTSLTSVTIPNSVTKLGYEAFSFCENLTSATIGNSVRIIEQSSFYLCKNLTSVTLPDSLEGIENSAFSGCHITSIKIPNSVNHIRNSAFLGCGLTSLEIPNSVTYLGEKAFSSNDFTSVTIGNSVNYIGEDCFWGCNSLKEIYMLATTPPVIYWDILYRYYGVMYVPMSVLAAYEEAYKNRHHFTLQGFDPTAVDGIEADEDNSPKAYYDLQGRKSDTPRRGLNIVNGKKILVK